MPTRFLSWFFPRRRSRTRQPNALANLALLRSVALRLFADHFPDTPVPVIREALARSTARCLALVTHP